MIRFEHPFLLYLLLLIPVFILLFILKRRRRKKALTELGNSYLIDRLTPSVSKTKPILKFILVMCVFLFLVLTLSNPQIGSSIEKAEKKGIDLVVCLDISNSMMAEDIQPNRLARAKQAISNMLDKLTNDRIGIVIFAGKAYTLIPLTSDYGAAKMFLETISPNMIETQGTAIGAAIEKAMGTLGYDENETGDNKKWVKNDNRAIIIISDGENHEDDAIEMAKLARKEGIMVNTIGMGLPDGVPIPVYKNDVRIGYKEDKNRMPITTKLNEDMLLQIAKTGNGTYARANNSNAGLEDIFKKIRSLNAKTFETQEFSSYESRFQFFLIIALAFLLCDFLIVEKRNKYFNQFNFFGKKENNNNR